MSDSFFSYHSSEQMISLLKKLASLANTKMLLINNKQRVFLASDLEIRTIREDLHEVYVKGVEDFLQISPYGAGTELKILAHQGDITADANVEQGILRKIIEALFMSVVYIPILVIVIIVEIYLYKDFIELALIILALAIFFIVREIKLLKAGAKGLQSLKRLQSLLYFSKEHLESVLKLTKKKEELMLLGEIGN